ncbi:hypothetical protein SY83_17990 [Paenibacillus swuensis]|uniref:Uncharacterized protein n=1 Tax=Paenibacillus swuensis TaxID=1178515 RepID=A0A172TLC3_9BACL|nr:hypothetical protein [Paenibacillus swuensis]ANE47869.1 hypothetical protein SY83_17990 [Paenibacillus swuensis]
MSRKWERMVQKNSKVSNKLRVKQGKGTISQTSVAGPDRYTGRSFILPLACAAVAVFFGFTFAGEERGTMYWFTVLSYLLLAVIFFLRKPYLAIGKDYVSTRKYGADKKMYAGSVDKITSQPGSIVITFKHSKNSWVLSRTWNRYDTVTIEPALQKFAQQNDVPFEVKAK